eukprot:CAMPEP_0185594348 /NCGR_PEP_ID=MMETSP0434-20130131/74516_1 /TAXON_ID=626734 ORGANISM="Favella taraikaensis, Strain Fe Narragansett Bay" /NCGR_SAMPLE_ID=MMETSP0434 /ASSEMBLY_ACC=CAM_ASM_000379 /LENGTH=68 /DNA_ID=CAMNT_0028221599 /DNA_START=265 /DNA_END=471 /DNA_ORIENTATION=+
MFSGERKPTEEDHDETSEEENCAPPNRDAAHLEQPEDKRQLDLKGLSKGAERSQQHVLFSKQGTFAAY